MSDARVLQWQDGTWTNAPALSVVDDNGMSVEATHGSDAWRHTAYKFVHDSEHALLVPFRPGQAMEVDFHLDFAEQFDQAGLFIRKSGATWVKAGAEHADGGPKLGAVVTHGMSDWSVTDVPDWHGQLVTIRVSWMDDALVIRARAGQEPFRMVRVAPFLPAGDAWAGPFCCAPTRAGLRVQFSQWRIGPGDDGLHAVAVG